jgi:hypothetical protein
MIQYTESLMVITLRNVTSFLERMVSRSVTDIHRFVPVGGGGRATKLQSSYQDVMIGPLTCGFMYVMRCQSTCVPSFHGALGTLSIGFRTPFDDMKSRVGAMISQ